MPLLDVRDLRVTLPTARGPADALRGVSFALDRGQTLGLIGESGCGKSITALALMGLLPDRATVSGSIRFGGQDLGALDEPALCRLRGNRIGMVFQEPMTALNPLHTVGRQVAEPLRLHQRLPAGAARAQALRLLQRVQLPQAAQRLEAYPHQLSGGQRQRVVIAMALACGPDLLIADEPTTALDATLQRDVLDLIQTLVQEDGMGLLLISHDLGVMAERVQQLLVMYAGTVAESGPTHSVFRRPAHPYTRGLLAARPRLGPGTGRAAADVPADGWAAADAPGDGKAAVEAPGDGRSAAVAQSDGRATTGAPGEGQAAAEAPGGRGVRLATIAGRVPALHEMPAGCPFADRCPLVLDACRAAPPPPVLVGPGHHARCIRTDTAWHGTP